MGGCTPNDANDEAAIRAIARTYEAANNEHDSSAHGALWAIDADAIILHAPEAVGRDPILSGQQAFSESSPETQMSLTVTRVRFVSPDVAIADFARQG